jgi:micrococcal nuclease
MSRSRYKSTSRSAPHRRRYTRRKALGYAVSLLIAACLILADYLGVFGRRPEPYGPDAATIARHTASDLRTYQGKSFKVTRVVDGDTLDVDVRDEVQGKDHTRIRLWGVDTPETVKPNTPKQHFGPEASRFTKRFCTGKQVRLELVKTRATRGKYGRLLAYVSGQDGTCLNAELIRRGYGYSDPRFPHPRKAEFRDLQRAARQNRDGLWDEARNSDLPYYYKKKIKLGR